MQLLAVEGWFPNDSWNSFEKVCFWGFIIFVVFVVIVMIFLASWQIKIWVDRHRRDKELKYKRIQYKNAIRKLEKKPVTYDDESSTLKHGVFELRLCAFSLEDVVCKEVYAGEGKTNMNDIEERLGLEMGKKMSKATRDAVSRINEKAAKKLHLQDKLLIFSREYVTINKKYYH